MLPRRKTIVLLICLFVISFKVAASSIFVQAAIERALLISGHVSVSAHQVQSSPESADDKEQFHALYLMSHVVANVSELSINMHYIPSSIAKIINVGKVLLTQNFPDTAFKPPKTQA